MGKATSPQEQLRSRREIDGESRRVPRFGVGGGIPKVENSFIFSFSFGNLSSEGSMLGLGAVRARATAPV
eukprot:1375715-Amorphochlora_amoeboformis.AAC.2